MFLPLSYLLLLRSKLTSELTRFLGSKLAILWQLINRGPSATLVPSAVLTSDAIWHYWTWSDLISGQIRSDVPQRGQIRSDLDQIRSNQDQVGSGQIRIRSDPIKIRSDQVRSDQIQWDQIRSGPMRKDLTWSWSDLNWPDWIFVWFGLIFYDI